MSDQAATQPRCPLGFTGPPPAGHPSIPGFSSSDGSSSSSSPSAKEGSHSSASTRSSHLSFFLASVPTSFDPRKWSTHQVFFVEVAFLVFCAFLAIYMPRIKGALTKGDGRTGGVSSGSSSRGNAGIRDKDD